jgi:triacylglycerol esterase/lipase EstA (alpha/beta hydrolase family)
MRFAGRATAVLGAVAAALLVVTGGPASASEDGPALRIPADAPRQSLSCHGDLAGGAVDPVLLIAGTTLNPKVNFDWNYEPAFRARHQSYCAVTLPDNEMADIQVAAEYVVSALRTMHRRADRPIQIVGFSQGGMIGRWALKFWPDTRDLVESVIGLDPSNRGTLDADGICALACAPSIWQQRPHSKFTTALNAGQETYPGISYTQIYSYLDEVVVPNLPPAASSELHTGPGDITNVAVQQICPGHVADHLTMGSTDPVGYALVVDALTHGGRARADRIDRAVCLAPVMPGVDRATLAVHEARYGSHVATVLATYPPTLAEPPLRSYARDAASE